MVASAALLVRERGARATSIDDVLAHSGAPRGSIYHHFPGGREELLAAATRFAGRYVESLIAPDADPLEMIDRVVATYREALVAGDLNAGCPVVAVAVEASSVGTPVGEAAAAAFAAWEERFAEIFAGAGVSADRAVPLAATLIAGIEGALILARARRNVAHYDAVCTELRALAEREIDQSSNQNEGTDE